MSYDVIFDFSYQYLGFKCSNINKHLTILFCLFLFQFLFFLQYTPVFFFWHADLKLLIMAFRAGMRLGRDNDRQIDVLLPPSLCDRLNSDFFLVNISFI